MDYNPKQFVFNYCPDAEHYDILVKDQAAIRKLSIITRKIHCKVKSGNENTFKEVNFRK